MTSPQSTPNPEIIPIGWDAPALELVASRLLDEKFLPEYNMSRATVVVPTMESGRRLKEFMARQAGRPVLMPRITQPGRLIEPDSGKKPVATMLDTSAAWLKVLMQVAGEIRENKTASWFNLFPTPPMGSVAEWAINMARQLMHLRSQMEQECISAEYAAYINDYWPDFVDRRARAWRDFLAKMGSRWECADKLFHMVDETIIGNGLEPRERACAAAAASPRRRRGEGLVILACVPELSPLNELYLKNGIASGVFCVKVLVNAPKEELPFFDAFGRPLTKDAQKRPLSRWLTEAICLNKDASGAFCVPGGHRHIHMVPDEDAMGQKAIELTGGMSSGDVVVAACDTGMAPAVHAAFLRAETSSWNLNLPAGRALSSTQEGQLASLLIAALQIPHRQPIFNETTRQVDNSEPNVLEPLAALMNNTVLQRGYALAHADSKGKAPDMSAFNACLDDIMRTCYPAHMELLLHHLSDSERKVPARFIGYATEICSMVQGCERSKEGLAKNLLMLAARLEAAQHENGGSILAAPMRNVADFINKNANAHSPSVLLALLRQEMEAALRQSRPLMPRESTHGDLPGWDELTFCGGRRLIICGMHDDCVPQRPQTDIFLPDAMRCAIGISSSESRTARDSFILTALLHSRKGGVEFIVSRTRSEGAPPAPSCLLLRCGDDKKELAKRASHLFKEDNTVPEKKPYRHWNLLEATAPAKDGPGHITDFTLPDGTPVVNPFADKDEFSPSFLHDFLTCPLRFWLKRVFRLDPGDAYPEDLSELRSVDYGDVMHVVLEAFVRQYPDERSLPEGGDEEIKGALALDIRERVEDAFKKYGGNSRAIMQVQKEQMQAALAAYAKQHVNDLRQGWRNVWLEEKVLHPLELADGSKVTLGVRIDRVDYNDREKRWRIIDYKSHANPPQKTHWGTLCTDEDEPRFAKLLPDWTFELHYTTKENKEHHSFHHWTELQLPLYAEALKTLCENNGVEYSWPEMAYYNVPRGQAVATYSPLASPRHKYERRVLVPFSGEYQALAMACAKSAIGMIRRGECLYSAEFLGLKVPYSSFGALTPDNDPRTMCGMKDEFNR